MTGNEIWITTIKAFILDINPEPFAAANSEEMDGPRLLKAQAAFGNCSLGPDSPQQESVTQ